MSPDSTEVLQRVRDTPPTPGGIDALYAWLTAHRGGCFFSDRFPAPAGREKPRPARQGKLVTLDGISGAGKDTQIGLLRDRLLAGKRVRECRVLATKAGSPFREVLLDYWRANPEDRDERVELALLWVGRRYFVEEGLAPALADPGTVVIQNRSFLSDLSFVSRDRPQLVRNLALCTFDPRADAALLLSLAPEDACERLARRAAAGQRPPGPQERLPVLRRTDGVYRWLLDLRPDLATPIDAAGTPEAVHGRIWAAVQALL